MFSNKENINILTSILTAKGMRHAVVCPGSRNAPIVHNLQACSEMNCWPVTDERSAGFYALGIAQATGLPTVVCVTSGTALLNLAPAVAEAHYQHIPLVVVSADRPKQWIDQLDGQTIPQPDALLPFVSKAVSLPEPHDVETRWLCNRLVNEAMFQSTRTGGAPVHINVPISEPLFCFSTQTLPQERLFHAAEKPYVMARPDGLVQHLRNVRRPIVVIGQTAKGAVSNDTIAKLSAAFTVFFEPLGSDAGKTVHFDEAVRMVSGEKKFMPDFIIYMGDTLVSKPTRRFLRSSKADTCFITTNAECTPDPTMWLTDIIECNSWSDIDRMLCAVTTEYISERNAESAEFHANWQHVLAIAAKHADDFRPEYSQMAAVKFMEEQLACATSGICTHYANSTAIRLANIYARHFVWCNRGVNGIEGSLSTAAGFSVATQNIVVCVIGDLSFFYDQNALWNRNIGGNLRILLLNNSGGGIFRQLSGLEDSPAAADFVEATHHTNAKGICLQNDITYLEAHDMNEMQSGISALLTQESSRPMLLEVFTDKTADSAVLKEYYSTMSKK